MADEDKGVGKAKLIQYLGEAHNKEKELEQALQAHIGEAQRPAYQKRLKDHLKETKQHSKQLERRVKKLGGTPLVAQAAKVANRVTTAAVATGKGAAHAVRGTGAAEKQLKNAKTDFWNEHEEIATYTAIETLATELGDTETAKLAKSIRREEERMASFLEKQIPVLTKDVVKEEIPSSERSSSRSGRGRSRPSSRGRSSTSSSKSSDGRKSAGRSSSTSKSSTSKSSTSKSSGTSSRRKSASGSSS